MTRELGLQEILNNSMDYYMSNIYTSMPGVIVSVDLANMRAEVKPAINIRDSDGVDVVERPTILNVPIQLPVSDKGGLTFPIGSGCPVELRWSMRGLDKWKRGNGLPDSPPDIRRFDIRDCIATPGIYPQSLSKNSTGSRTNAHSPDDVVLVHNIGSGSEVEIRLKPNGDVQINSPTKVEVNCKESIVNSETSTEINTGSFTVNSSSFNINTGSYAISASGGATQTGNFTHVGDITHNGNTFQTGDIELNGISVDEHTHSGVVSGGDDTAPFNAG